MEHKLKAGCGMEHKLKAGCGMEHKLKAGCVIREIWRPGYGMKISSRDRETLVSIGGMCDSFEIVGGMRDLNRK